MPGALNIRLEDDTLAALDRLAEKTERSRNWLVARAVEDYVALNVWQIAKIETGLAAAERGHFADDQQIARVRSKFASRL